MDGLELRPDQVDTNMIIFHVDPKLGSAAEFCARLKSRGLLMLATAPTLIRAVTHLDVDQADVDRAAEILEDTARQRGGSTAKVAGVVY